MADCDDNGLILRVGRLEDLGSKHYVIASMRKAYEAGERAVRQVRAAVSMRC